MAKGGKRFNEKTKRSENHPSKVWYQNKQHAPRRNGENSHYRKNNKLALISLNRYFQIIKFFKGAAQGRSLKLHNDDNRQQG